MRIVDTLSMAARAISRNKIRSLLTALGIIMGVASVIAIVQLGQASTAAITDKISSLGSNLLIVIAKAEKRAGDRQGSPEPFTPEDVDAIKREVRGVRVAPQVSVQATMVYGNAHYSTSIDGTTNAYLSVRNRQISKGRRFTDAELARGASVCILGTTVVDELFDDTDPLGQTTRVGRTTCEVVGVLVSKGGSFNQDRDDLVLMPLKAVQLRLKGNRHIYLMFLSTVEGASHARVKWDLEALLKERRTAGGGGKESFKVRDIKEVTNMVQKTTGILTALLAAIAAISLLVGGIGIMNIMLVSVTERTREIGLRLAIGARARDVLTQFLVEAVAISTLGGLIGLVLGVASTWAATRVLKLPFILSVTPMVVGVSFSVLMGVVFGFLPARKAALLNPIEALRHE